MELLPLMNLIYKKFVSRINLKPIELKAPSLTKMSSTMSCRIQVFGLSHPDDFSFRVPLMTLNDMSFVSHTSPQS